MLQNSTDNTTIVPACDSGPQLQSQALGKNTKVLDF